MIIRKLSGKDYPVKNLSELFSSDKRKLRNELFGSYLSKTYAPEAILVTVQNNIKESEIQLSNLKILEDELEKLVAEEKAKKLLEDVKKMSDADAQALYEQLKAKLGKE